MLMRFFLSVLLLLSLPVTVFAQDADTDLDAPLPSVTSSLLEAAALSYDATIQYGGEAMELEVERVIEEASYEGQPVWRIVESMVMPMNAAVDTFELDPATLRPVRRSAGGGGTHIVLEYGEREITGSIQAAGHEDEIAHELNAEVFADGAGLELALSTLPLEEGYETLVRTFDPQAGEPRPMQLTVIGTEAIEMKAGSYDTYIVDLEPLDDSQAGAATLHLMQSAPHYLVQGEYELPAAMGGGSLILRLATIER